MMPKPEPTPEHPDYWDCALNEHDWVLISDNGYDKVYRCRKCKEECEV